MEFTNVPTRALFTFNYAICFTASNNSHPKYGAGRAPAHSGGLRCFNHNIAHVSVMGKFSLEWDTKPREQLDYLVIALLLFKIIFRLGKSEHSLRHVEISYRCKYTGEKNSKRDIVIMHFI